MVIKCIWHFEITPICFPHTLYCRACSRYWRSQCKTIKISLKYWWQFNWEIAAPRLLLGYQQIISPEKANHVVLLSIDTASQRTLSPDNSQKLNLLPLVKLLKKMSSISHNWYFLLSLHCSYEPVKVKDSVNLQTK